MDMIYILENPVCCYRYDRNLRARAQFIDDLRFKRHKWTDEDEARFDTEEAAYREKAGYRWDTPDWYDYLFMQHRAEAPDKTLVVLDYCATIGHILRNHLRRTEHTGRSLVVSFFHNDEEMGSLLWMDWSVEEMIEDKVDWIGGMMSFPFIKTVEIGYNFTLTEAYLKDLFVHYFDLPER